MDTPFNGRIGGNLITIEFQEFLGQEETRYVVGLYSYFGNGTHTILDGCCGGVLWDDNHDVLGQFGYLEEGTGKCYGPSFDLLRAVRYTLAEI